MCFKLLTSTIGCMHRSSISCSYTAPSAACRCQNFQSCRLCCCGLCHVFRKSSPSPAVPSCSAGIMAAKHTPTLIPMCHSVPLDKVQVQIEPQEEEHGRARLEITATASATHRTGNECLGLCISMYMQSHECPDGFYALQAGMIAS